VITNKNIKTFCTISYVNSWKQGNICNLVYWFIYGTEYYFDSFRIRVLD